LYPQYTSVDDVLLPGAAEGEAAAAPAPAADETPAPEAVAPAAAAVVATVGADAGGSGAAAPAPKKKRRKEKTKAAPSGPGNAEEAARIRQALGIVPVAAVEVAAAAAAAAAEPAAPAPTSTFAFGFDVAAAGAPPPPPATEDAAPAAAGAAPLPLPPPPTRRERRPRGGRSAAAGDPLARRVFVGGMPFSYEEDDVRAYWEWCGEVASLDVMRFPDTGRFRGIAFVSFATDDGYRAALECDGTTLDGVRVKVEPCKAPKRGVGCGGGAPSSTAPAGPAPKTAGYNVGYVGNVAFEASADDLGALFAADGRAPPTLVRLHTDKLTGRSKGYAHVHFATEADLDAAVAGVDGADLMGRGVRVGYAQPKKGDAAPGAVRVEGAAVVAED